MSKYCPMRNAVTNCTENCTECLREEENKQGDFDFVVQYGNQKPLELNTSLIQEDVLRTRVNLPHHKEEHK